MAQSISYRRAETGDIRSVYEVFYRSLYDYLFRIALIEEETAKNPPISSGWQRHAAWFDHLWTSAAENWIAEEERGIVGWAMSIVRDDHLELTHCFVEPGLQTKGIGRNLVRYAFPDDLVRHKAIIATQDPRALAVYLRSGVNYVTTSVEFIVEPHDAEAATDLVFENVGADDHSAVDDIALLESTVLGYRRDIDTRFLLRSRPAWLAKRAGSVVGFAFGAQKGLPDSGDLPASCGPIASVDTADMPAILDQVIAAARAIGESRIRLVVPLVNTVAVGHLLSRGAKIDPFYVSILASDRSMRLDHWVHTTPLFIM